MHSMLFEIGKKGTLYNGDILQKHANMQVYKKALEIIETNFTTEESTNDDLIQAIKNIA